MNVRITPRGWPNRTDLYVGVAAVSCDRQVLKLHPTQFFDRPGNWIGIPLPEVAEIALDDDWDPGVWW